MNLLKTCGILFLPCLKPPGAPFIIQSPTFGLALSWVVEAGPRCQAAAQPHMLVGELASESWLETAGRAGAPPRVSHRGLAQRGAEWCWRRPRRTDRVWANHHDQALGQGGWAGRGPRTLSISLSVDSSRSLKTGSSMNK